MSAKAILEADGKAILNYHLTRAATIKPSPLPPPTKHNPPSRLASLYFPEDAEPIDVLNQAEVTYPWLLAPGIKLVAKPDQLIKRRGKSGLLALNKTWPEAKAWVAERAGKAQKVEHTEGVLRQFLVEPFVPHPANTEYYININSVRDVSIDSLLRCFIKEFPRERVRKGALLGVHERARSGRRKSKNNQRRCLRTRGENKCRCCYEQHVLCYIVGGGGNALCAGRETPADGRTEDPKRGLGLWSGIDMQSFTLNPLRSYLDILTWLFLHRAIGSFSPTKVVSMSVMSTRRQRSC